MNELIKKPINLPSKLQDLTRFVLIGREKLVSVRAEIRAINKLELAQEVKEQKQGEAQGLAGALLDAETKIGEILAIDVQAHTHQHKIPAGITRKQSSQFQLMAEHREVVEQVKAEAEANDDLPTRTEVLRQIKEKEKFTIKENKKHSYEKLAKEFKNKNIEIRNEDFRKTDIRDNSIDLILTDPLYPEEFLPLWEDLFKVAERILKPSKFLVCYANHQNLDKIFRLNNNLKYYWIFKIDFTKKPIAMGRNLIATWKPILIYQKLPFKKIENTIEDSIKFTYTERELHDKNWGQTLAPFEYLLEKFSEPNDLVFEPFAGSGTTLLACKNKKRKCIGTEIDKKYIDLIKGRLI